MTVDVPAIKNALQGYKGGSESSRNPVEAPDSLVSTQQARIVDLISEGEIWGLVNGVNSIFLDEAAGSSYPSLQWDYRLGTQDQSYLQGFPSVESNTTINVKLTVAMPYIRPVSNTSVSALRINFSLGRFARQDSSSGDTTGIRVEFAIDVASGFGEYQTVYTSAFDGKTSNGYTKSVRVDLPHPVPTNGWRVKVRRLTPDATASNISDAVNIASVTEIIDYKFRYPNSAVIGLSFDAETFGGAIPKRSYHIKGRIIRVPSNYNPQTRTYTGVWDGEFQLAWSDCPPWIYYDLLLNERFGLGDRISASQIDKWGLYEIARYCDELVDNGRGGLEPRFTCNLYLQKQAQALKVMQDLAAVFRGITYWGLGQAMVSADMPRDPVYTYTNGNVLNGRFNRKGAKKSTIYTAILSAWNDPNDFYRVKYEYVQDDALVAKFGIRSTTLANIGCSSQGQAHRAAKWALLSNQYDTNTISFGVGLEGIRAMPGQVVRIADQHRQGRRVAGRVRAGSTKDALFLDQLPGATVGVGDEITLNLSTGESETRVVDRINTSDNSVIPASPFSADPVRGGVWAYDTAELKSELYRILSISEGASPLEYSITALTYTEGKHAAVDTGAIISRRPTVAVPLGVVDAPQNVLMSTSSKVDQSQAVSTLHISWDKVNSAIKYDAEWQRDNSGWIYAGRVSTTEVDVVGVYSGEYKVRVRAMNSMNVLSPWTEIGPSFLTGKVGLPPAVASLTAKSILFGIELNWTFPAGVADTQRTEIWYGPTNNLASATKLSDLAFPQPKFVMQGLRAGQTFYFWARLVDRSGNIGPWSYGGMPVVGVSSSDPDAILDMMVDRINEEHLGQLLQSKIDLIEVLQQQVNALDGLKAYDPNTTYVKGQLVVVGGQIYQASGPVPVNTPPPNALWKNVGELLETANGLAGQISTLTAQITELNGVVVSQAAANQSLKAAVRKNNASNDLSDALAGYNAMATSVTDSIVKATQDAASARTIVQISATVGSNVAQVTSLREVVANNQSATAQSLEQVNTRVDNNTAQVTTLQKTVTDNQTSTASSIQQVSSKVTIVEGDVNTTKSSLATTQGEVTTTKNRVTTAEGKIEVQATNIASLTGKVTQSWSVRMQQTSAAGVYKWAGFGIGLEEGPNNIVQSSFYIAADKFAFINDITNAIEVPFALEGGQTSIKEAFIKKATIQNLLVGVTLTSSAVITSGPNQSKPVMLQNFQSGAITFNGQNFTRDDTSTGTKVRDVNTGVVVIEWGEV